MDKWSTRRSRRHVLQLVTFGGIGALAGCNQQPESDDSRADSPTNSTQTETTSTETVVFTNTETKTSTTTTPSANKTVFDGGDAAAFDKALQRVAEIPGATLEIEPGTYHLSPAAPESGAKPPHFAVEGLEDATIEGNNSTLKFAEPTRGGLNVLDSTDVKIQNLTFDYDPLPFTQGTITELRNDERTIVVELDASYPSLGHEMFQTSVDIWASVHTSNGEFVHGIRKHGDPDKHFRSIERLGERRFALTLRDWSNTRGLQLGRSLAIVARNNHSVLKFYKVQNPSVRNVTVHSSNGGGVTIQVCDQPSLRKSIVAPPANSDRLIATNADGIRIINCLSKPTVENCRFEYLEDDGIVVQHTMSPVTKILDDDTIEIGNIHPVVAGVGDVFATMAPDGKRKGKLPPVSEMDVGQRVGGEDTRAKPSRLTFESSISATIKEGDLVGNLATASRGFTVRNNVLRNHRGRLVRIAASDGVIEGNTLEGSHLSALELESEGTLEPFAPKGWVEDVVVRNNTISRPGLNYFAGYTPTGIRLNHVSPDNVTTAGRPNRNVTITNNTVDNSAYVGLLVADGQDIQIESNDLSSLNQLSYGGFGDTGIELTNVAATSVIDNRVEGTRQTIQYFGIQRDSSGVKASQNELIIDGDPVDPDLVTLQPLTLRFSRTSDSPDRKLAFYCRKLALLDANGDTIQAVDVGANAESGVAYGEGVYGRETTESETFRWFGGTNARTVLYFGGDILDSATELRLYGNPYDSDIRVTVSVGGTRTDEVSFGTNSPYTASLQ